MINPVTVIRGGKEYELHKGQVNGKTKLYFQTVTPDSEGLYERLWFRKLLIDTEDTCIGEVNLIKAEIHTAKISPDGNVIDGTVTADPMKTNDPDMDDLIPMFEDILNFLANGIVRNHLGFNNMPVYDSEGEVIEYTEAEENSEPTNDY